jgi:hypothetical protein
MHKTGRTDGMERDGRTHRTDGGDGWTVWMAGTDVNGRTGGRAGQTGRGRGRLYVHGWTGRTRYGAAGCYTNLKQLNEHE